MSLPLTQTDSPTNVADVARIVQEATQTQAAIYPLGGETSLDYGIKARLPGRGISLKKMDRVIDYPARDMTITVEAGITIAELQKILAAENQELPIDVPQPELTTLGGAIATNASGPRRFGLGTWRDYIIGIEAVDGLGRVYHAGGRVVKNVAGYDFCRLLIGSCGTLGIITQVTLKVKPKSETSAAIVLPLKDTKQLDAILDTLSKTKAMLAAVEVLSGPRWKNDKFFGELPNDDNFWLAVFVEGSTSEVNWMTTTLEAELRDSNPPHNASQPAIRTLDHSQTQNLLQHLTASLALSTDDSTTGAPLFGLKSSIPPSQVPAWIEYLRTTDPTTSLQSHGLTGIVYSWHSSEPKSGIAKWLLDEAHPKRGICRAILHVWSFPREIELTSPAAWGSMGDATQILAEIQKQFDPQSVLNPGRFW